MYATTTGQPPLLMWMLFFDEHVFFFSLSISSPLSLSLSQTFAHSLILIIHALSFYEKKQKKISEQNFFLSRFSLIKSCVGIQHFYLQNLNLFFSYLNHHQNFINKKTKSDFIFFCSHSLIFICYNHQIIRIFQFLFVV